VISQAWIHLSPAELEGDLVGQQLPGLTVAALETVHDVAHRARDQEVLLHETQATPGLDVVGRVEHARHRLHAPALLHGLDEVAAREDLEVELRCGLGVP